MKFIGFREGIIENRQQKVKHEIEKHGDAIQPLPCR
jgi:hypothetical protein